MPSATTRRALLAATAAGLALPRRLRAGTDTVTIGVMNDMTGPLSSDGGMGSAACVAQPGRRSAAAARSRPRFVRPIPRKQESSAPQRASVHGEFLVARARRSRELARSGKDARQGKELKRHA